MTHTSVERRFPPYTPPTPPPSIRPALRPRRVYPHWVAPLAVGAIVLAVALATMSPWPVGVFYDDGIYLILGKALATGEGYRYVNLPGHPAATHYPPGYPALLALLWLISPSFPENVALFKLANAVLLSLAAAGLVYFARRDLALGTGMATVTILLGCLTVPVLAVTSVLFSEPLFLALLAVALPACERALRDERSSRVVVAALLASMTALVRTLGLPLVGGFVALLLVRRRYRAAGIAFGVAVAMLLPWQIWTAAHSDNLPPTVAGNYGSYTAALADAVDTNGIGYLARVAAYNARDIARPLGAVFAPGVTVQTRAVVVTAFVCVLAVGAIVLARRAPVTALFLLGYAVIVIAWPYAPDRFLWGVWPLLLLTLAMGAAAGVRGARDRRADGVPLVAHATLVVAAGALAFGVIRYNSRGYQQRWWDAAQRSVARQILPLVEWTQQNTRPGDLIASDGDPLVHLYTGRHVVPSARWAVEKYPQGADSASAVGDLKSLLAAYPVRYLLLGGNRSPHARATAALQQQLQLELLAILNGGGAVFVIPPDELSK